MERPAHHLVPGAKRRKSWLPHALAGAFAGAPILALMSFTPDSWWRRNGFSEYPGTYVRLSDNDYRLCRPWGGPAGGSRPPHRDAALRISERRGELEGGKEANFAVLLPKSAHVEAIYCGAAISSAPLQECSGKGCAVPMHIIVDDGQYTLGRGIILGFQARNAEPNLHTGVGFWVLWSGQD